MSARDTPDRERLAELADEQAALRRIATLVARGVPDAEIFDAVTEEVHRLLRAEITGFCRFDADGQWTLVAVRGTESGIIGPGDRWHPGRDAPGLQDVYAGRPIRVDAYSPIGEALDSIVAAERMRSWVASPIMLMGQAWGSLIVVSREGPMAAGTEHRLAGFNELVATAIANAESHAQLVASRARIAAAADDARQRIQRDLHDGAQQRVVTLALKARALASSDAARANGVDAELLDLAVGLDDLLQDLRDISSGLHPAVLSKGGLEPALKALARRSPVPVALDLRACDQLMGRIETAAYYIVAEMLTNAAKHANAEHIDVNVEALPDALRVRVQDDGIGGADPAVGSGLIGVRDRVEALGGNVIVDSPPGVGTTLVAELPLNNGGNSDRTFPAANRILHTSRVDQD